MAKIHGNSVALTASGARKKCEMWLVWEVLVPVSQLTHEGSLNSPGESIRENLMT